MLFKTISAVKEKKQTKDAQLIKAFGKRGEKLARRRFGSTSNHEHYFASVTRALGGKGGKGWSVGFRRHQCLRLNAQLNSSPTTHLKNSSSPIDSERGGRAREKKQKKKAREKREKEKTRGGAS